MKLIITESQYRMIVEYDIRDKVFNVPGELLEDKDSFYRMYKLYRDNKESKNYVGIKVIGDFNLFGVLGGKLSSELIDFCGDLLQVDGDLRVINNYVVSLPKLRKVSGDMTLSMTEVRSLPELRYVGRNLTLNRSKISELPKLESVGEDLNLDSRQIESLPKLESVGGGLFLKNTPIKDLGNLISVGGGLDLDKSQIESLPKLESVGGYLYLEGTPLGKKLSETMTKDEVRNKYGVNGEIYL